MAYKICFGIPSYLPDDLEARSKRSLKINNLFQQLNDLWPEIDILVIAQNWQQFKPIKTRNNQLIKTYAKLGILRARKTLREEFLKLDYDYIIMLDDDIQIECTTPTTHLDFINEINRHKDGFCFIPGQNNPYHPYIGAQLNLCAISRFIYEQEPMVDIDPQKNEGYEDTIYACLLHYKWNKYEFTPPATIKPIQDHSVEEKAISTWCYRNYPVRLLQANSARLQEYIVKYKELPPNYKDLLDTKVEEKKSNYLYF